MFALQREKVGHCVCLKREKMGYRVCVPEKEKNGILSLSITCAKFVLISHLYAVMEV